MQNFLSDWQKLIKLDIHFCPGLGAVLFIPDVQIYTVIQPFWGTVFQHVSKILKRILFDTQPLHFWEYSLQRHSNKYTRIYVQRFAAVLVVIVRNRINSLPNNNRMVVCIPGHPKEFYEVNAENGESYAHNFINMPCHFAFHILHILFPLSAFSLPRLHFHLQGLLRPKRGEAPAC